MYYNWIIGLHSILRWVILLFLLINISKSYFGLGKPFSEEDNTWNLRLFIVTHITLLLGLFEYFFGGRGIAAIKTYGMHDVMKNGEMRFFVLEHVVGMIIAIVLITISRPIAKSAIDPDLKHKKLLKIYISALVLILLFIPWHFRFPDVPWFRWLSA